MPVAHILRTSKIVPSFRVEQIRGMFDVPDKKEIRHEWSVSLPVEEKPWQIGLILGPSGAGKSTIARECFPTAHFHEHFDWPAGKSILDAFPAALPSRDITAVLNAVGFSSPPHWLKPFAHLSNGQKFRAELARCLLLAAPLVIFDEFTSVVDRTVAKICSAAVAKTLRKKKAPQLIAVSCHYDILDWLQPDWTFDVASNRFEWRRLRRFPQIRLDVRKTDASAWPLFRGHHYLSGELNPSAHCYVALWQDQPVAFAAVLHFPHPSSHRMKREHRVVVLPDFQGIGIGNRVSEFIADLFTRSGFRYMSITSHPAMIRHRASSPRWRVARWMSHVSAPGTTGLHGDNSIGRLTARFEYVMPPAE